MVSVVVATSRGREALAARRAGAYRASGELELIIRAGATVAAAWAAGAAAATGDFLHLSTDQLEPHPGWLEAARAACLAKRAPVALVYRADGTVESPEGPLLDWRPCEQTTTVAFMPIAVYQSVAGHVNAGLVAGDWPGLALLRAGLQPVLRVAYAFTRWP